MGKSRKYCGVGGAISARDGTRPECAPLAAALLPFMDSDCRNNRLNERTLNY